ncbi:hypothetical protein [Paenibacillus naphthalenovorans]|uniref:hypothetical protein n=1 Tax=Paenibacillus naphthalenovorans TaxID=162209 RepID=UPI003D282234
MNNSKDFVKNQLNKWKNAAAGLLSSGGEAMDTHAVELEPEYYEKCRQMAEVQNTTVSAVVHYMIEQYFAGRSQDTLFQTTADQKDKNPLLQLDALIRRKAPYTPEEAQEYDLT